MNDYLVLLYEIADGIAKVNINRPESFNAINAQVLVETTRLFKQLADDPQVKAVILGGGNEKFYAAGADIREMIDYSPDEAEHFISLVHDAMNAVYNLRKPTIAAISGLALGGGLELTLSCDLRIAADNAVFGLPEINLGVHPGGGGTQILPKLIGAARAKELVFLGEMIDARTALNIGLVNRVVPFPDLMPEAQKIARKLCRKPPVALELAKELINCSMDLERDRGLEKEKYGFSSLFATKDQKEGMKAFMENRRAVFAGS
ncbi:MAG: enoyl-CoA hydratase/isomerase family protein [Solirubrobacterales bacterium]